MRLVHGRLTLLVQSVLLAHAEVGALEKQSFERLSHGLACNLHSKHWQWYHTAYKDAAEAAAAGGPAHGKAAARCALAEALLERTSNLSDILNCNVGVVAGYYLLARLVLPVAVESFGTVGADEGEAGLAYRLLQLALVFIFTLRNANRIPEAPGVAWGVSERFIIPTLMRMRKGQVRKAQKWLQHAVPIAPEFRDRSLQIAVVSICAYPANHPLALPSVTPPNRDAYTSRHGYHLRLHLEPPILGAHGLGLQHAKLATVLAYLQSGKFDWVAWFDCDSIIMNMNRTLDSIIYQYAQQVPEEISGSVAEPPLPVCGAHNVRPDLSGQWLDSWVPPDLRQDALVSIYQTFEGRVVASSPQFGEAPGVVGEDESVELEFDGSALRGRIILDAEDTPHTVPVRLEWDNGAIWSRLGTPRSLEGAPCREPCVEPGPDCAAELDPKMNLLITEEGWGLSSANWLIRRSAWSMEFLHAALTAAHVQMRLFGDQDAIILHLMNEDALRAVCSGDDVAFTSDPLSRHASVIPQFELNAYDALNALTMECDTFVEGDLLITFPQCKDAEGCNDVFNLAAAYASDLDKSLGPRAGAWWSRAEGPPRWSRYSATSAPAIRIFGPRPLVQELFFRERLLEQHGAG